MFLKVIACEVAARELYFAASRSHNLIDIEFLTQGYHDTPATGKNAVQERIDAVPAGKYDAILLGYGLCSNILAGLTPRHAPLVIPRAHDCITFFLGSKERYQQCFNERPGTYYYTSGWLECAQRRGEKGPVWGGASLPAGANQGLTAAYSDWVKKFGEDQAKYLLEEMGKWSNSYTHGALIDFDFTKPLELRKQVEQICADKGWEFTDLPGDLVLVERLLSGEWPEADFLVVPPGQQVVASYDDKIIAASPIASADTSPGSKTA
jgi:hypothetical protein